MENHAQGWALAGLSRHFSMGFTDLMEWSYVTEVKMNSCQESRQWRYRDGIEQMGKQQLFRPYHEELMTEKPFRDNWPFVTGIHRRPPLWGGSTGHWWIPLTKGQ